MNEQDAPVQCSWQSYRKILAHLRAPGKSWIHAVYLQFFILLVLLMSF